MEEQRTLDWYRARLGHITGSQVSKILGGSRKKDEVFGETAKTYLNQLAAERTMAQAVIEDDDRFSEYLDFAETSSKAIRWGVENEDNARKMYEFLNNVTIEETGSTKHHTLDFASSPDGLIQNEGVVEGCIEIKCVGQSNFVKYSFIKDNETFKKIMPDYYWQCQSHMMVTGAEWCDFVVYCPFQRNPMHIARILPSEEDTNLLEERIRQANEYIEQIVDTL